MSPRSIVVASLLALGCSSPPSPPPPAKSAPMAKPAAEAPPQPKDEPAVPMASTPADARGWPIEQPQLRRAPAGEDAVVVKKAGAEPKEALRFSPAAAKARTVSLDMTMQVAMTLGNNAIDPSTLPTVAVRLKVTPGPEEDGKTPWAFEVVSASREPLEGASARLEKAMDTAVEGMRAGKGRLDIDARGRRVAAEYGLPEVPTPNLRPSLAGFQQSFSQLFVVFPEEPVGVGAQWTSTTHFELSGIPIEQRASYTLLGREGDTLSLKVDFEQSATGEAESPAGVALEGTRFGGRGAGTLTVGLDAPFPTQAEALSRSRVSSSVTMGGGPQPVEMDLLSTLSISSSAG